MLRGSGSPSAPSLSTLTRRQGAQLLPLGAQPLPFARSFPTDEGGAARRGDRAEYAAWRETGHARFPTTAAALAVLTVAVKSVKRRWLDSSGTQSDMCNPKP